MKPPRENNKILLSLFQQVKSVACSSGIKKKHDKQGDHERYYLENCTSSCPPHLPQLQSHTPVPCSLIAFYFCFEASMANANSSASSNSSMVGSSRSSVSTLGACSKNRRRAFLTSSRFNFLSGAAVPVVSTLF